MQIITITASNFEQSVLKSNKSVVVDFWAPWCGYCKRLNPVIDKMSADYDGKIIFGKVNIDEEPSLAQKFAVNTIPTLIAFKNGNVGKAIIAPSAKADVDKWINEEGLL